MSSTVRRPLFIAALGLALCGWALAHEEDEERKTITSEEKKATLDPAALQTISAAYEQNVKPIFDRKCNDCHSNKTVFPWYYKVPGVKQYIDDDVEEGREHLDISNGFPFASKHGVGHDLEEISDEVSEGGMPPKPYTFMHRGTTLSDDEKRTILSWAESARKAFNIQRQ